MRVDRRLLNWGVFFVIVGAIPLAVDQGWISRGVIDGSWRLWPLILVGLGIGILLRRTPADFLGGLIVAVTIGYITGGFLTVGPSFAINCSGSGTPSSFATTQGSFSDGAQVELHLGCGTLDVTTGSGTGWTLVTGNTSGVAASIDQGSDHLIVRSGSRDSASWLGNPGRDDWRATLPTDPRLGLEVEVDAGDATVDLPSAKLDGLSLSVNAGSATVDLLSTSIGSLSASVNAGSADIMLPATSNMSGSLSVNAGSANICSAAGVGLRITSSEALASTNFGSMGLVQNGNTWQSPGYDNAVYRIDLSVSVNLGSVTLNPAGGCK